MNLSKYNLTRGNMYFILLYCLLFIIGLIYVLVPSIPITKIGIFIFSLFIVLIIYVFDYKRGNLNHLKKYIGSVLNPKNCSNLDNITKQSSLFYGIISGLSVILVVGIAIIINFKLYKSLMHQSDNPLECNGLIILISLNILILLLYISLNLTYIQDLYKDVNNLAKQKKILLPPNRNTFEIFWVILLFIILILFCIKTLSDMPFLKQLAIKGSISLIIIIYMFHNYIQYNMSYINSCIYTILNPATVNK